jgi:hypothetical protein
MEGRALKRPGRWLIWVGLLLVVAVVGLIVAAVASFPEASEQEDAAKNTNELLRGFSLSPKSFDAADYPGFFPLAAEYGNTLSWAGHYSDLNKTVGNAAKTVLEQAEKHDLAPILITGPNNDEVLDGIGQQGLREAVLNFVKSNAVPYLGLGNEIDEVYGESPARYATLINLLQTLAQDVKAASPETKVFTVFQLERVKGLQGGLFGKRNDPNNHLWKLVSDANSFDFVAFTTYPCLIYKAPAEIPEEYYSDIANHTAVPVIFTEIGWFRETPVAGWEADEAEQTAFIERFAEMTVRLEPKIVIWPFFYDQPIPAPFENMGLLGTDQTDSAGLTAWRTFAQNR